MSSAVTSKPAVAPIAVAGLDWHRSHPLTMVVRLGTVVSPLLLVAAQMLVGSSTLAGPAPVEAVLVAVGYLYATAAWFRFRFRIGPDVGIELRSGLLLRQRRSAAPAQVRVVDIAQPLLARLLGLAELRVRVAGGHGSHLRLRYLRLADARRYQEELLAAAGIDASEQDEPLITLKSRRLVLATLLTVPTLGGGATVIAGAVTRGIGHPAGAALVLLWSYGYLTSLYRRYQRFSGFTLTRARVGLRIRQGLSDTMTLTIPLEQIKAARITQPLLWRVAGLARVEVSAAGQHASGSREQPDRLVLLPVGDPEQARVLVELALGCDLAVVALSGPPARAHWLRPVGLRMIAAGTSGGVTVMRRGLLRQVIDVIPACGIESARIVQGPLQRRLDLATVAFDCVRGPVRPRTRHLDMSAAQRLIAAALAGQNPVPVPP
jgi:putative membrane protein